MANSSNIVVPIKGLSTDLSLFNTNNETYPFAYNAMVESFDGGGLTLTNEPSNKCSVVFPPNYHVVGFREIPEQNRTIYLLTNPLTGNSQIGEVLNCQHTDGSDSIEVRVCQDCPEAISVERPPLQDQKENCYCQYRMIISDVCVDPPPCPIGVTPAVYTDGCLGFSVNYPIDIEYKITNCSLNIYFTDVINERRFVYFNYTNNDPTQPLILQDRFKFQLCSNNDQCQTPVYCDAIDCQEIKFHPNYQKPCVVITDFVNGGNLKAGTYQVLIAYADPYGNPISSYFPSSNIMPLFINATTFETNYDTNKALSFSVTNLKTDSLYKYYNIVIARTVDQFTDFTLVNTLSTSITEYVYTGFEKTVKRLDPTEVFFKRPYYKSAKGVTKANDYLFFTGVKEYAILNLQPIANRLTLNWETVALPEGAYRDPRNTFYFRTYQRDEVYSFAIIFEMTNGRETCAFHIPGRAATSYDLHQISGADVINDLSCDNPTGGESKPRWQVYNTGSVTDTPHEYNPNCETDKCWERGTMAYWESTELYPNIPQVWGNLCGTSIRHHKFPDCAITHIHDGFGASNLYAANNYIFPIGITIDHATVIASLDQAVTDGLITATDRADIVSYRIVRGNRVGNKSVTAKGLLYNMFQYNRDNSPNPITTYYFPNYPYNDLRTDDFLGNSVSLSSLDRFTFHSPDTHFVNTGVGNILKVETEEYGQSEGYYTFSDCQAKQKFLSVFAQTLAFGLGLAAAISATGEKQCKVIEYSSDTDTYVYNYPTANISGGATDNHLTNGTGHINTSITTNSPTLTNFNQTNVNDNLQGVNAQNTTDGTNTPVASGNTTVIGGFSDNLTTTDSLGNTTPLVNPSKVTYTTCKGQGFQIFNSDTFLGGIFAVVNKVTQQAILGILEMNKIIDTIHSLIPKKNYSVQYNSIGKYNNYVNPQANNKIRLIDKSAYLEPYIQDVDEPTSTPTTFVTKKINNWERERSVYLKLNTALASPSHIADNSKCTMANAPYGVGDLNKTFYRNINSYYVSLKDNILDQYGQLCNIEYLETTSCSFFLNQTYDLCQSKIFGGDTFINRFALKRKMPFFTHTMCNLPDESDVLYSELANVGTPLYYFNTAQPLLERISSLLTFIPDIILSFFDNTVLSLVNDNRHNFDVSTSHLFFQEGYAPLFAYGIPYFLVESDINVDYRYGQDHKAKDFYPHNSDLKTWLEEGNVPIETDNYFFYNRTYSKQNKESSICTSCILDYNNFSCQTTNYNRLIYSGTTSTENNNDNWLVFKANDYYDFPLTLGRLITADGIEDDKVLVRLEMGTQIFNAYNTIQATGVDIQVGTGGIFATRPRDISVTDLGYAGTQNRDILHTEYGHIWADAQRGQVFNLSTGGGGMEELGKDGMKNWFKENLPFEIKKQYPTVDIDNNLNGVGLHYCFDKRFNRIIVTKLDYKALSPEVQYDGANFQFFIPSGYTQAIIPTGNTQLILPTGTTKVPVELYNPKYFCNKSWTISYNFYTKSWTSWHSYHPNFYIEHIDTFDSGRYMLTKINGQLGKICKAYTHNFSNKSYQVFYGKLEPFIVEFLAKQSTTNNVLNSVEYYLDVIRYHGDFDVFYNRAKTFNKAIIYNERQTSGLLYFKVSDPEDLTEILNYPKRLNDGYEILTTNSENVWRFNDFFDVSQNQLNNIPLLKYDCANVNKTLNQQAINYAKPDFDRAVIRQRMCRVRLINDAESNYLYRFNFSQINQRQSFR